MELELTDRTVFVSGSHRGTGRTIANHFKAEGARVIVHGPDEAALLPLREDFPLGVTGKLWTDEGCQAVIAQIQQQTQTLDVLVNNYGTAGQGTWSSTSADDWRDLYEHNVVSVSRITQGLLPMLNAAPQGRIINLGTIGSTRPNKAMPHYYAAKGALATLTAGLAKAVESKHLTVNLVSPGLIRTPEVEASYLLMAQKRGWGETFDDAEEKITEAFFENPLGRIATRAEVADVVVFLASARASFVNGQNIRVDGGAVGIV